MYINWMQTVLAFKLNLCQQVQYFYHETLNFLMSKQYESVGEISYFFKLNS